MLKALLLSLMNLALAGMAIAQNLVMNGSFEDTTYCLGWPPPQLEAIGWHTANTATPDLWNCDTLNPCGYHVMDPNDDGIQIQGYKFAYDGNRFVGGFHWYGYGSSNTREYLSSRLQQPMTPGQSYRVSMWCARPAGFNGAIDHLGVYFGSDSVYEPYPTTLPFLPQAELRDPSNAYIQDTSWTQLADTITATGIEEWLILGTFNDADNVNGIWLGWGSFPPTAYYYLDQLEIVPIVPQATEALVATETFLRIIGPSAVWNGSGALRMLRICDAAGKSVWERSVVDDPKGPWTLPMPMAPGVYVLRAITAERECCVRFIK